MSSIVQTRFKSGTINSSRSTQLNDVLKRSAVSPPADDPYVRRVRPGMAHCKVCDRAFSAAAKYMRKHAESERHKKAVAEFEANQGKK